MTHLRLLPPPESPPSPEPPVDLFQDEKPLERVNPSMLVMARTACDRTQSEFASLLGIQQSRLSKIEDWLTDGVPRTLLERCSEITGYPVSFFTQTGGQKPLRESFFRRRQTITTKSQKRAEALINIKRQEIEKLLSKAEMEPALKLPRWPADEFDGGPREIARQLRYAWGIPRGPITNLTAIAESAGCVVIHFDFGTPKIDGVSTFTDHGVPLIFLNPKVSSFRLRLTLAHELAHAIMHDLPTPNMEEEAFEMACEFLAPESEIGSSLFPLDLDLLARLKLKWGMSMQAILRWAKTQGKIKDQYYKFLSMKIGQAGWKNVEPYDNEKPIEQPTLVRSLVDMYRQELGYSSEELREVMRANSRSFAKEYFE